MSRFFNRRITNLQVTLLALVAVQLAGCSSAQDRAQSYYRSGMELLAAHQEQKAAIEFRNAIRLNKNLLPAWEGLAQAEEAVKNWQLLVPVLRDLLDLDPKNETARVKLAKLLLLGGAVDESLKLVNDAQEGGADDPALRSLKAVILYKLKDSSGAVREGEAALKLDPDNVDALMVLAAARLDAGDPKGALKILSDASDAQLKDLGVQLFKIRIYEQLKDFPQIEALLRKLAEAYPQEPAFRQQLAKFYLDQHRPDDAEKEIRGIAAADPSNANAGLEVVRFLYSLRGPAAAREELVSRINAGGAVFPYQLALAQLDYDQGKVADSFKLLESLGNDQASAANALAAKIRLAELNRAQKNTATAEKIVEGILSKDSRNADALRLRATIHLDRGELDAAISDLRTALNDQPRSANLMLLLANAYERSGSIELADKEFADAMKVSDFDANVGLNYVAFLRRRSNADRAFDVLTDLANRWPKNLQVLSALADMKLARQDWAGAQEIADAIKRIGGNNGVADQILGTALVGRKKYDESIAVLQDAVSQAPTQVQPMVALVGALVRAKQSDRAISFLQSVLKASPNSAEAYVLLGSVQLTINQADQAAKNFATAIQKQPKDPTGYRALADLYFAQKKVDAAIDTIRAGLKEQPDSQMLHMTLAGGLELKGDYDGAISEYEYLEKQQPGSMVISNNLASMLADHRTDKASLDRAQSLAAALRKSDIPQFKDTLGWVNYRQGDLKAAVPLLEAAATELPNVALIHYHLAMSYLGVGQVAKASEQLKLALARAPDEELQTKIKGELKSIATE